MPALSRTRSERAVALLLAVAVLCVLATLGVTLVRTTSIERASSGQYVLAARAREMCSSGVAYAIARLREDAAARSYDAPDAAWVYRGEDQDGDGALSLAEDVYAPELGRLDELECPLEVALAPSFPNGENALRLGSGRRAVSGLYASADGSFSATDWDRAGFCLPGGTSPGPAYLETSFTLKVADCASQLDANGGRWAVDPSGALTVASVPDPVDVAATAAMIDTLWRLVTRETGLGPAYDLDVTIGKGLGRHLADVLDASGPGAVFATAAALESAVRSASSAPGVGAEIWRRAEPYLTCHPWRDPSVIRPSPRSKVPSTGRRSHASLARAPRAPINVNTADWRVLTAAWTGLAARYAVAVGEDTLPKGALHAPDEIAEVALSAATAEALAKRLVAYRHDRATGTVRAFTHAGDLDRWLDGEVAAGTISALQATLVKVQAHPDAQLVNTNPDYVLRREFDKTDLLDLRTELAYSSMGRFEIQAIGRVALGTLDVAQAALDVVAEVYSCEIDTDYADFERGEASPATSGAPTLAIHPGVSPAGSAAFPAVPLARASGLAYDGRVGIAPLDPDVGRPFRFHTDFTTPGDGDSPVAKHPLQGALMGAPPVGTRFVDGAYGEYTGPTGAYPVYEEVAAGKPRWTEHRGAIAFWYKPNWAIDSSDTSPHSIASWNGKDDAVTFQLYFSGRKVDRVSPEPKLLATRSPKLVLLVWDSANKREGKIETPLIDDAGAAITGPGEWMHLVITWDASKVVLGVRSRFKDPGAAPPVILADDTGGGGPLTLLQPIIGGAMGVLYWPVDPGIPLPDLPGLPGLPPIIRPPIPPGLLPKPSLMEMEAMRLGGPLKTRAVGAGGGPTPRAYKFAIAPSEGTYANLWSLERPDASDPSAEDLETLLTDPAGVLLGHDLDHDALDALYRKGRYHNGDDYGGGAAEAFGRFRSRALTLTAGQPLGTISWRSHTSSATSLVARVLRKGTAGWEEVPDPSDPSRPLSFFAPGTCAIPRTTVDAGLGASEQWGPIRYQFHFVETIADDRPLIESPFLESVLVTVLTPPEYVEWSWRTK